MSDGLPACRFIGRQAGRAVCHHGLEACSPIKRRRTDTIGHIARVLATVAGLVPVTFAAAPATGKVVRLQLPPQAGPVVVQLARVFARQVADRSDGRVVKAGDAPLVVELATATDVGPEGYRIEDRRGGGVRVMGRDDRGLVAGVGKFLRTSRYEFVFVAVPKESDPVAVVAHRELDQRIGSLSLFSIASADQEWVEWLSA
ncbi:MAG: hypothetical protein WCQ21_27090 [Verrucomicrobiota bacterium]